MPGADHPAVHYLRSIDDSDRLRARLRPGTRLVIIGGGWIGLETAAAARAAGAEVTVLEHAELPLLPVLGRRIARVFAELHTEHGVDLRCGVTVAAVQARGSDGVTVLLDGDTRIDADAVVVGIGAVPNDGLAPLLRVVAAMNVNVWEVAEPVRQLIRSGHPVDAARLADPDVPLEQLA